MRWTEEQLTEWQRTHGVPGAPNRADVSRPPFKLPHDPAGRYALGRLPAGKMNKTEAAYAEQLELQKQAGEILWWKFEGVKLRLADNTFLTVDFAVLTRDGFMEMREVKGFMEDDANVKLKVAASIYPFKFLVIRKAKGGWSEEAFG